jgi:hypothetical protein
MIAVYPVLEANKSQNIDTNSDAVSTAHKAESPAHRSVLTNAQLQPIIFNLVNFAVLSVKLVFLFIKWK